uniref:Uncharacterized protein n=1 Tax=Sphaerodactylus townsendi TaxID=933632 RepID=A0ACB8GD03_9SAUR
MAAHHVGRQLGRSSPACSSELSPGMTQVERMPSLGIQRCQAQVTVKYNHQDLQRRLNSEKWIDRRLEDLYQGRETEIPDEGS